jgi:hypothetical protein
MMPVTISGNGEISGVTLINADEVAKPQPHPFLLMGV